MPAQPDVNTLPPDPLNQTGPTHSLAELERISWEQLTQAAEHKKSQPDRTGFKTMTVATCTNKGADARMVVLRRVDADRKYVWFYTDARAEKVIQMEAFPDAMLLFWDDKQQVQLRLAVETRLHTDDYIADEHWQALWVGARKAYLSEPVPGSEQPEPYPGFPAQIGDRLPTEKASETGRKNFAVIECRVLSMDYLRLSSGGQTRAYFQYEPESRMVWLAP